MNTLSLTVRLILTFGFGIIAVLGALITLLGFTSGLQWDAIAVGLIMLVVGGLIVWKVIPRD